MTDQATARTRAVVEMPYAQLRAELRVIAMTVAAAFRARGFEWGGFSKESHIPDVNEIEASLIDRLKTVVEESATHSSSSGRALVLAGLLQVSAHGAFALAPPRTLRPEEGTDG